MEVLWKSFFMSALDFLTPWAVGFECQMFRILGGIPLIWAYLAYLAGPNHPLKDLEGPSLTSKDHKASL